MQTTLNKPQSVQSKAVTKNTKQDLLSELTASQQRQYNKLPESMDYICAELFHKMEAWDTLFGPEAKRISVENWSLFPEVPEQAKSRRARKSLSADEEQTLFLRYNFARYRFNELAKRQKNRFSKLRALSMLEWNSKVVENRDAIVAANMGLVVSMATRTRVPNVDFSELVSEGNMALLRAVDKFDTTRGFKFSTYACRAILKSFNRLATTTGKYVTRFGASYEPEYERSDYDVKKHEIQQASAADDVKDIVTRNTANLSDTEQTVVINRFGLETGKKKTLAEVGEILHLSNERIRQIQKVALGKIYDTLNEHYLAC